MAKVTIYVAYHKPAPIVNGSVYRPIHVGKALSEVNIPGTIGDDTGDNISRKNPLYCEMTAAYWAWKNDRDSDYIGLCHYRRFFSTARQGVGRTLKATIEYLKNKGIGLFRPGHGGIFHNTIDNPSVERFAELQKQFEQQIEQIALTRSVDVFCVKPVRFSFQSIKMHFNILNEYHTRVVGEILKEFYPDLAIDYGRVLASNQMTYANMVVMRREIFEHYCSIVFDVLDRYENRILKDHWCQDLYAERNFARLPGYMAELLTATYIEYLRQNKKNVKALTVVNYGV